MTIPRRILVIGVVPLLLAVRGPNDNAKGTTPVAATISDVAWIAGHWYTNQDGDVLDELWSEPEGDCMMGMFRWMKSDKVWIYELLTIREEESTLVLRFRHFGGDLTAWEPKGEPLTYRLSSLSDREAVFENPDSESHRLFAFRRSPSQEDPALTIRVGAIREGKLVTTEFHYRRR